MQSTERAPGGRIPSNLLFMAKTLFVHLEVGQFSPVFLRKILD